MGDTLILSHTKQFAIPLSQVALFRIEKVSRLPKPPPDNSLRTPYNMWMLFAISKLPKMNGAWFDFLIDEFESEEAVLERLDSYATILRAPLGVEIDH